MQETWAVQQIQVSEAMVVAWPQLRVGGARPTLHQSFDIGSVVTWQDCAMILRGDRQNLDTIICRAVARLAGSERFRDGLSREEGLVERTLHLTDGQRVYTAVVVRVLELSRPFMVFFGTVPGGRAHLTVCDDGPLGEAPKAEVAPLRRVSSPGR